ncbi:MAG: alkaline phosphatase family protein [Gammaproteobacteria bacterium]|nr:alkaline phosphatase family protein [Gammaproteobacteria bacterium]
MILPDYRSGSIVNLMQSIRAAHGDGAEPGSPYGPLALLPPETIARFDKIVLLVIDGLGYEYLREVAPNGALAAHLRGSMTSVFPSTTASAITTFLTGSAPLQHAMTGWFMWLEEIGEIVAPLPFTSRMERCSLTERGLDPAALFDSPPLLDRLAMETWVVQRADISDSHYTRAHCGRATTLGYKSMPGMFQALREVVLARERCFVYAYWPELDAVSHKVGASARRTRKHLRMLDACFAEWLRSIAGSGTLVLVSADHGFVDTSEDTRIYLRDHPELAETLTRPLCGEQRVAYCYVDPARRDDFERYVSATLADVCEAVPAAALLSEGYLGLGDAHPRLAGRIGDYVLVMRDNFVIRDHLPWEQRSHDHVGVHGGVSAAEMHVPLVVAEPPRAS